MNRWVGLDWIGLDGDMFIVRARDVVILSIIILVVVSPSRACAWWFRSIPSSIQPTGGALFSGQYSYYYHYHHIHRGVRIICIIVSTDSGISSSGPFLFFFFFSFRLDYYSVGG